MTVSTYRSATVTAALAVLTLSGGTAFAQSQQPAVPSVEQIQRLRPPPSARPVPGPLELPQLIWGSLTALEHANRTMNYSVLLGISSQAFQRVNNQAQLAQIFSTLRASRVDLTQTLLVPPTYVAPPQVLQDGVFQVQGVFPMRPLSVQFDLIYQWDRGSWRLAGIDVVPVPFDRPVPTR